MDLSIILPCLNEESGIVYCLDQIKKVIASPKLSNLQIEVIVSDNGSTDKSREIVRQYMQHFPQLRLVEQPIRGYGAAYLKGIEESKGKYIFMADSDGTYDFNDIPRFVDAMENGAEFVIGNRFAYKLKEHVMPWLHKYIGNPFLSFISRLFFKLNVRDFQCGSRAISRAGLNKIELQTQGMEFASEMVIKAAKAKLKIVQLPIEYHVRLGTSKLNSFGDGWRNLRFILIFSPFVLFLIPGLLLLLTGIISMAALYFQKLEIFNITFVIHPIFLSAVLIMIGYQLILFGGYTKIYAVTHLGDRVNYIDKMFKIVTIEKAGFLGLLLLVAGGAIYAYIFTLWFKSGFSTMDQIKNSVVALTLCTIGIQTFFSAFMFSMLTIRNK